MEAQDGSGEPVRETAPVYRTATAAQRVLALLALIALLASAALGSWRILSHSGSDVPASEASKPAEAEAQRF